MSDAQEKEGLKFWKPELLQAPSEKRKDLN